MLGHTFSKGSRSMKADIVSRLRGPKKWVSLIEGDSYMVNSAPQEAADYIELLESMLVGEFTNESNLQSDSMEQSGVDIPLQQT